MNVETNIHNVLVVGVDVVSLATSASKADYHVYAVDFFGDQDLKRVCHESRSIIKQKTKESCGRLCVDFDPRILLQLVKEISSEHEIDATLLASGLDDFPEILFEINELIPILGNHLDIIKKIRNRTTFFQELKRLGVPHPKTAIVGDFSEAKGKSKDIGYPVAVKPSRSFGGAGITKARNIQELKLAYKNASQLSKEVLIQEHISGTKASASLISSASGTATLTLNQQLLGMREVNQHEPFGYCGNVVPLSATQAASEACHDIAEKIVSYFSLIGSNGIDFVISKDGTPYVIEVNPRFQGTLECVERVLGINLVKTHTEACIRETLPTILKETSVFCTRLILFASKRVVVPDLSAIDEVRDMPFPGVIVEQREPVCSIVTEGMDKDASLRKAKNIAKSIHNSLKPYN